MKSKLLRIALLGIVLSFITIKGHTQFLMDMLDTTKETGKSMLGIYKSFGHLRFSGYIQPQFQLAQSKGVKSFEGGDFASQVSNRFMLRRSRVRTDYIHFGNDKMPGVQIAFQFDVTERGFTIRDVWGRIFENKYKLFSFTIGMFARPISYELNLSSSDRETPERGRMSQILMKSERDLGAMISFDVRKKTHPLKFIKFDVGLFNGQGINSNGDFDNSKDLIMRLSLKPYHLSKRVSISAGTSMLLGALLQNTKYKYITENINGVWKEVADSNTSNLFQNSPRRYYEADVQLKIKNQYGFTEFRAEYISGTQTGTQSSSETPTALISGNDGFRIRKFNGAYFYFLQHLFSEKHQFLIKYDWYDPNTKVKGTQIGAAGSNLNAVNIKYSTLGFGYVNYVTENLKLMLFYARVWNEKTSLVGFTEDLKDDVFTCRIQFRF